MIGLQEQREEKETKQGLEDWKSQSLGCPPSALVQPKTLQAWREDLLSGCYPEASKANKYYLQMGRRSQEADLQGREHRLWRSPTSNKTGRFAWSREA